MEEFMVFLVFIHPIFLFSDPRRSNYFGPKAHGPGNRARQSLSCGQGPDLVRIFGAPRPAVAVLGLTCALLLA